MCFQSRPIFINKQRLTSTPETSFTHSLYAMITTILTSNIISWIYFACFWISYIWNQIACTTVFLTSFTQQFISVDNTLCEFSSSCPLSWLCSIPLCEHTAIIDPFPSLLMLDIWEYFWILQVALQRMFLHTLLNTCTLSCGIYTWEWDDWVVYSIAIFEIYVQQARKQSSRPWNHTVLVSAVFWPLRWLVQPLLFHTRSLRLRL